MVRKQFTTEQIIHKLRSARFPRYATPAHWFPGVERTNIGTGTLFGVRSLPTHPALPRPWFARLTGYFCMYKRRARPYEGRKLASTTRRTPSVQGRFARGAGWLGYLRDARVP